jgi:putative ABC transport system substrate-binding protein
MRRREFLALVGGAVAAWPLDARAQQGEIVRHVGVLMTLLENDTEAQNRCDAFVQKLRQTGWRLGGNLRVDYRMTAGQPDELRMSAEDLVKAAADVILATGSDAMVPLLQATRSLPIVFVDVSDPVGSGFVATLTRPGGNATGFAQADMAANGQWLEMLKLIAAGVKRIAVLNDPTTGLAQFAAVKATAEALNIPMVSLDARSDAEIANGVAEFARLPDGVLVVTTSAAAMRHRDLIVALAAKYKVPAVYSERLYPAAGGLLSIGPDQNEEYRMAADYVDRILKGEKPAEMPVRASAKIRLVINRTTAHALGLVLTPSLLARADEVID